MIETKGIVHFSIPVSDLARSQAFYTGILGLQLVAAPPGSGMVFLRTGPDYLVLCQSKTSIAPNVADETLVHHAFMVDPERYDDAKAFLQDRGVRILLEENRRQGVFVGRQFYFHDPDRNVLEISEWRGKTG